MLSQRTEATQQLTDLLRTARQSLGLGCAFLTRLDGTHQTLELVDSTNPDSLRAGMSNPRENSFCQAILDGRLPPVMADVTAYPEAMKLPGAQIPWMRSFVSVPVVLSDGTVYGTFCAAGFSTDPELAPRDRALMDVLSHAASVIIEPGLREAARHAEIAARLGPVLDAGGPVVLLQPIVDLKSRVRVGAEALSRFPRAWDMPPDRCFADAHAIGEGHRLELLALRRAAAHLDRVPHYVTMNVSPATLMTRACTRLLDRFPLDRVVLELSEHEQVEDYEALKAVLAPLRARGMRLAIDDVGAGFSSLRHIVLTAPDVIKLDRSIVTGIGADPVLSVVTHSLVDLARATGAIVVAEGVETEADATALIAVGVDLGQGWLFGRAISPEELRDDYAVAVAS
ncbi:sensor domain-containing phosphodiesterase [Couchioplanes caeruleus]|uniref:Diguanylate phosphodiesterase n=2 Tax=Couchioplanes caeruleus TaxID=56438 RepID=A0A1K0FTY0_9ACTN|nr:EAL domain-containing protein [Couchioplanes caeruleus]OJF16249.1 diguanylate phosphodiesterase [Couchioplanes caeruleus subsp. caeruleus]ROP28802.1 EAL domain-containing protein (putative c-di-GMP-specific phosphodiesterase class I) [Couchioplanes caeruleus]